MELQTIVGLEKPAFQIRYDTPLMLLGSCFVENIGARLEYFRFKADINPCGIVYNPLSVADTLTLLLGNRFFTEVDLFCHAGKWGSFHHHGQFSAFDPGACLQKINTRLEEARRHFRQSKVLVITWGTAWVYRYKATGQIVSNCHKFPAAGFDRFRLNVEEIVGVYEQLLPEIRKMLPDIQILFTISPIRHWKDGAHGNQLSKAVLHLALDRLLENFGQVSYFPSYEIVMDELRDYRFYAEDMLHISPQGINYIWEKFSNLYIPKETQEIMKRVDKLNKRLSHRPLTGENETDRLQKEQVMEELKRLGLQE